jgi:MFS family permease
LTAAAGDRFSRRRVFRVGAVMTALFAPVFFIAASREHANLVLLFFVAGTIASLINGTYGCAIAELFPVDVRFSGVAAAMNFGLAVTMGLTPLTVSFLVADLHWTLAPALVMLAGALVAFASTFGMKRGRLRAPMIRHE